MLFAIHAKDKAGALPIRAANFEAHKAHLSGASSQGVAIVMSGPLVADDGATTIGSLFVVEAADRETVERFHRADPFHVAGIWREVAIDAFLRRIG